MIKKADGAKRDFGFNVVCAHTAGGMDSAGAKAKIDFIDGGADILPGFDFVLIEA